MDQPHAFFPPCATRVIWQQLHPELNEIYRVKEAMRSLYESAATTASRTFTGLTDELAHSTRREVGLGTPPKAEARRWPWQDLEAV